MPAAGCLAVESYRNEKGHKITLLNFPKKKFQFPVSSQFSFMGKYQ